MAITVSYIVGIVRERCEDLTESMALSFFNEIHQDLSAVARIYPDTAIQITNLVAGTREYPLDDSVGRIWDVTYSTQLGSYNQLRPTSIDELDNLFPGWRETNTTGVPQMYYVQGGNIGVYPLPDTTSNNGYPLVGIFHAQNFPLLGINDSLPGTVVNANAWVYGMCERWAAMKALDSYQIFATMAARAKNDLIEKIRGRVARKKDRIIFRVPRVRQL